jgi:isoleucyl-tRNA synthetase
VTIQAQAAAHDLLSQFTTSFKGELPQLFIVSDAVLTKSGNGSAINVSVERAGGSKCERCWHYSPSVGQDAKFITVCSACAAALREMGL